MASREDIALLRSARAGDANAQIALAKRYLFGGAGLPKSFATSLHWLDRAARQGEPDAWRLIGMHIPFDAAVHAPDRNLLCKWYERAFDGGLICAGLVLAKLVLTADAHQHEAALRRKAWQALETAAEHGLAEAQWMLAQELEKREIAADIDRCGNSLEGRYGASRCRYLDWARRAAESGVMQAQRMLANHAWRAADDREYLHWALPLAQSLVRKSPNGESASTQLSADDIILLSRCARALFRVGDVSAGMMEKFSEVAARAGDSRAQYFLGLWLAKMDEDGRRIEDAARPVNFRKAIHWLTLAGQHGMAAAWYAVSRIYLSAEFAHRSISEAEKYLAYSAESGDPRAQLELARRLWRKRAKVAGTDVLAVYWMQRAASQGCLEAARTIAKCASVASPAPWVQRTRFESHSSADPFIVARLKLAAHFGLTEREALLLDIIGADRGHCLEIDIRDINVRIKRRLILIQTAEDRLLLDKVKSVFEGIKSGMYEPEGNYRQRLYRMRRILTEENVCHSLPQSGRSTEHRAQQI